MNALTNTEFLGCEPLTERQDVSTRLVSAYGRNRDAPVGSA